MEDDDYWMREDEDFEDDYNFRNPGGNSALRNGVLRHPCPTCGEANTLTDQDVALGYQCDSCADRAERGGY